MGSFARAWWKLRHSGNRLWGSGNWLWLANCCPSHMVTAVLLRTYYEFTWGRLNLYQEHSKEERLGYVESFSKTGWNL